MAKSTLDWITLIILFIGGLNWGLVALNFNLVESIFGIGTVTDIVYILVGLSAIWTLVKGFK